MPRWSHGWRALRSARFLRFSRTPSGGTFSEARAAALQATGAFGDRRPSRTPRLCCAGSRCAVLGSSSPWTPSSSACHGSGRTCRGSRPIPITVAAVALGLALRLRRDAFPIRPERVADPRSIRSHARSRRSRRRRTRRCSTRCGRPRDRTRSPRRSARRPPTSAGSPPTAPESPATPCSRTPTGPDALPRSPDSGR